MICDKYLIVEFIGKGKFGEVYKGVFGDNLVAIKIENNTMKLLKHETTILHYLYRKGCKNIPIVHWFGVGEPTVPPTTPSLSMCGVGKPFINFLRREGVVGGNRTPKESQKRFAPTVGHEVPFTIGSPTSHKEREGVVGGNRTPKESQKRFAPTVGHEVPFTIGSPTSHKEREGVVGGTVGSPTLVMTYYEKGLTRETLPNNIKGIFCKMISIIENIHQLGVIHRDIKTSNFMFDANGDIHLIDFGFATFYIDKPNSIKEYILGTPSFISINIHNGNEPSRRDDLISLGYIYLYLTDNENPLLMDYSSLFCNLPITDSNLNIKHPSILEKREGKKWENLSKYLNHSSGIYKYLEYCYLLKYEDKPDYKKLMELLCGSSGRTTS
jgi:serine/threonine protein kinase